MSDISRSAQDDRRGRLGQGPEQSEGMTAHGCHSFMSLPDRRQRHEGRCLRSAVCPFVPPQAGGEESQPFEYRGDPHLHPVGAVSRFPTPFVASDEGATRGRGGLRREVSAVVWQRQMRVLPDRTCGTRFAVAPAQARSCAKRRDDSPEAVVPHSRKRGWTVIAMDNRLRLVAGSLVTLLAAGFTYYATGALPYYPAGWRWLIVLAVAALGLAHATNGVLLAQAAILLPIAYTSVTLAVVYLLLLAIGSLVGAFGSLVVAVAVVTLFQKQLAALLLLAPLLAGFAGRRRGAVLGGLACLWTELLTLLAGRSNSGPLVVGPALGQLAYPRLTPVSSLLDFSWFKQAAAGTEIAGAASSQGLIQTALLSRLFTPFLERPVLLAQMALWALAAAVVSALLSGPPLNRVPARIVAVAGGAAVLLIGHVALPDLLLGSAVPLNAVLVAVLVPAAAVALAAPLLEALPVVLSEPAAKVPEAGEATARPRTPGKNWPAWTTSRRRRCKPLNRSSIPRCAHLCSRCPSGQRAASCSTALRAPARPRWRAASRTMPGRRSLP
jgi:hypothetical protein